jgi:hypothetical protein
VSESDPGSETDQLAETDAISASRAPSASGWRAGTGAVLRWLVPEDNPSGAVYGTLTVGALLAAETNRRETLPRTVGAVMITLILYWLAHGYADRLGHRLPEGEHQHRRSFVEALIREWAIIRGSAIPLFAIIIAWVAGASVGNGIRVGLITSAAMLVVLELIAGVRAKLGPACIMVQTLGGALLGVAVLALRIVLH